MYQRPLCRILLAVLKPKENWWQCLIWQWGELMERNSFLGGGGLGGTWGTLLFFLGVSGLLTAPRLQFEDEPIFLCWRIWFPFHINHRISKKSTQLCARRLEIQATCKLWGVEVLQSAHRLGRHYWCQWCYCHFALKRRFAVGRLKRSNCILKIGVTWLTKKIIYFFSAWWYLCDNKNFCIS